MPAPASPASLPPHHGYYSGGGYTFNAYPHTFPLHLSLAALLAGQRPPPLDRPFQLVEFGCGQGLGLCLQAAIHPEASFWGIDLLPTHISHGRQLAAAAGLANVQFQEADLIRLAGSASPGAAPLTPAPPAAGSVDLAVSHGVLSWVGREVQQALWQLSSSCLRPGGLLSLSYNAFPGLLSHVPFQHLVRSLQGSNAAGSTSLEAAHQLLQRLQQSGSSLFSALPGLGSMLGELQGEDPAYLPHEYNQQHWQPRFSDAVIGQAADHGLSFLTSAALPEIFEQLLPPSFQTLLAEQSAPAQRQLLRDLLTNTSFRRDIYCRGFDRLWPLDHKAAIGNLQILRTIDDARLERCDPNELFRFSLSFATVQGDPHWFSVFLRALGSEPRRIGELSSLDGVPSLPLPQLLPNLALLLDKGLLSLVAPAVDHGPSQQLNRVLVNKMRSGAPYRLLAAPVIGNCLKISDLDGLALAVHLDGHSSLMSGLDEALHHLGRQIEQQGRVLEGSERASFLRRHCDGFLQSTLPELQRLGAVA